MSQRSDKLIIIAIIQNLLENMKHLLETAGTSRAGAEKKIALQALGKMALDIHFSITGEMWKGSPRELTDWFISYMKSEATKLGVKF